MKYGSYTHIHVSEREPAHQPNDPSDPPGWEDCAWASAVMVSRARGIAAPATLAEAEALRKASGEPAGGGSNLGDVSRGTKRRYGWEPASEPSSAAIGLRLGEAAIVQGSMGAFAAGHPLRRHDPHFAGAHAVAVFKIDGQDRVWWDDPLAPDGYSGEWVSEAELQRFTRALRGGRMIRTRIATAAVPDSTVYRYGGEPKWRGEYRAIADDVRIRERPFTTGKIVDHLDRGERFHVSQTTEQGSSVGGSKRWHGDATGTRWIHSSLIDPV